MFVRLLNAPPRLQSAFALALLAAILLGAGGVAWSVAAGLFEQKRELIELRERAGRLQRLAATTLPQEDIGVDPDQTRQLFMVATSLVIARADLQQRLNAISAANAVNVASVGNLPDRAEKSGTSIGLRLQLSGTYENVLATVAAIEGGAPPLIVREMTINAVGLMQPGSPPELSAEMRVYAAVRLAEDAETSTKDTAR